MSEKRKGVKEKERDEGSGRICGGEKEKRGRWCRKETNYIHIAHTATSNESNRLGLNSYIINRRGNEQQAAQGFNHAS